MEWVGTPFVAGSSPTAQYILVTLAIAGLQFVWSIEQAYVNVYLLDLGMTKSSLSLMWVAGPLCGLVVQPLVGVASDFSTNSRGRRRPYMVWGSFVVGLALVSFAWASELAGVLALDPVVVAVTAVLLLDVAVNTCQACCRALIVDMFSTDRQTEANGWAGRMASVGHLVSYYLGSVDLTFLGFATQMKAVSVVYSLALIVCVAISSSAVKERVLIRSSVSGTKSGAVQKAGLLVSQLWRATSNLDAGLRSIFKVQLLAWYAWFTFLFYGSTYASEVWGSELDLPPTAGEMARAGSLALAVFSLSSTVFTFVLPRLPVSMVRLWTVSFTVYAVAIMGTRWASSYNFVLTIFAVVGFSWAATLWIPFALTSKRIHELPAITSYTGEQSDAEQQQLVNPTPVGSSASSSDSPSTLRVLNDSGVPDSHSEESGIILGIHNSALTLPQFISTFGSYWIFQLLDVDPQNPHQDGGRAIAVTLQVGAFTALLAAFYAHKVGKWEAA